MVENVMSNKKIFNKKRRELLENGYTEFKSHKNKCIFRKYICYTIPDSVIVLTQGWKRT